MKPTPSIDRSSGWAVAKAAAASGLVLAIIAAIAIAIGASAVSDAPRGSLFLYCSIAAGVGFLLGASLVIVVHQRTGARIDSVGGALKEIWDAFCRTPF